MLKLSRAKIFVWLMLALGYGFGSSRGGEVPLSESQLKAAFLLNFPKYIEWPSASFAEPSSPIVIAILGNESVADEFAMMSNGKLIDGHPIQLLRNPSLAQCLECHVLFVGFNETRKMAEIISQLKCASILTVGENEQFMDQGGMINLALRERRVVLEVNLNAARETELKISSKLMALATVKGGEKVTRIFRKLSIRRKQVVIIMLTTTVALLLACSAFVFYDMVDFRSGVVERLNGIAQVIADHSAASLDFSDPKTAEQTLQALRTESDVIAGCIYDRDGHVFAQFTRDGHKFTPPLPQPEGHEFIGGHMRLFRSIKEGSEVVGTICVESDLRSLPQRLRRYAAIAGMVFVIALAVALILSSRLHRVLSNPVLHLAKIARSVAEEKNYSVRATKMSEDESGQLIDGFNEMLTQIQQRDNALQAARDTLENRVEERTNELANSLSLLNATLNSTEDGILAVDLSGRAICHNERFPAMWGIPKKIIAAGRNEAFVEYCATLVEDPKAYLLRIQELLLHPDQASHDVLTLRDGRYFERVIHPQLMNGRVIGRVLMFRDITERKRSESNLQKANAELVQASRRAGMAEIATNVLHNVGNVLNSVNTSATLVMGHVRESKLKGVSRVVDMLEPHAHDLGGFFTSDKRGPQVFEYLKTLSHFLAQEHHTMLAELTGLSKNIEHIKQIVAMQQSYAKASGVEEIQSPVGLVEDALRIHLNALEKHNVKIIRDYEKVPDIVADKHKVLQILINLIGNAKYALVESPQPAPQTILGVRANGGNTLHFTVRDNGVGIPHENLIRIFSHGFTTRKNGHGFGLHSGFLAAKEMGGSLSVHSDGPGLGAVFTLELPMKLRTN